MTEHEKARRWREKRGLTIDELAELTGYGYRTLYWFERGQTAPNTYHKKPGKISAWVWQRYKMTCAGVDAQLRGGKKFDW